MVQHPPVKGVLGDRLAPSHHSGHQTGHGIDDGHRGNLPAGQDAVPHRNLKVDLYREGILLSTLSVRRIRFNEGRDSLILESDLGDRDEAAALSGALVLIDAEDRVELPDGHFWIDDLIGLRVEDLEGRPLGTVKDILTAGASETYEIWGLDGRVHYVPAVEEFVRDIDLDLGRIRISLIEGLWD